MSAIQCYKGTIILPSSKCMRQKYTCTSSYLADSTGGYNTNHHNVSCFYTSRPAVKYSRRRRWTIRSVIDDGSSESSSSNTTNNGGTRLFNALKSFQINLTSRIDQLRKGLSLKILFFLLGFYCATAFATVIGQTGDWDILSAGLAVVVVEGIGALMYRASIPVFKKIRGFIGIFNYWKAGLSLGLFLDAFKYESSSNFESFGTQFDFRMDMFPGFW